MSDAGHSLPASRKQRSGVDAWRDEGRANASAASSAALQRDARRARGGGAAQTPAWQGSSVTAGSARRRHSRRRGSRRGVDRILGCGSGARSCSCSSWRSARSAARRWAPTACSPRSSERGRLGAGGKGNPAAVPAPVSSRPRDAMAWTGRSSRASARSSATTGAIPIRRARRRARSTRPARAGRCSSSPRRGPSTVLTPKATARPTAGIPPMRSSRLPTTCARRARLGTTGSAIFAYNHARWYVDEVEAWAAQIRVPRHRRRAAPLAQTRSRRRGSERNRWKAPTSVCRKRARRRCASSRANAPSSTRRRPSRARAGGRAGDRPGDGGGGQRAAGPAIRAGRAPRPAGRARGGLLEHRQLRALSLGHAPARGNPAREPARPGLRRAGARPVRVAG